MKIINSLSYLFFNILETLLRFFPIPAKIGLVKIGEPNEMSPVFLTVNFHLTVLKVKKALRGLNCYLLVANSHGINVWCATAGGHFNNRSVISILKTSGINELVKHRKIILPQLAAVGIEKKVVKEKTGWNIIWGPVYAKDIPIFLRNDFKKEDYLREIKFTILERLEMVGMWSFLFTILVLIPVSIFWINEVIFVLIVVWLPATLLFILFPYYEPLLKKEEIAKKSIHNLFTKVIIFSISLVITMTPIVVTYFYSKTYPQMFLLRWTLISSLVILSIIIDLKGSTPTYKSDIIEESKYKILLDKEKCKGTGICIDVCPRNCYSMDEEEKKVKIVNSIDCIKCGACIVQCPFDALSFITPTGKIIQPETIRTYKLNLSGKRV
ncbi:MAG: HgcAB-like fusion protein [Candidatus Heimdallarchaeaceae archaeon]